MIEHTRAQKIRCLAATLHALQEMERIVANEATTYEGDYERWDGHREELRVDIVREVSDQAINEGLDDEDILHLLQELKATADRERELVWEPGKPLWLSTEVNDIAQYCTDALQYNLCKPTEQAARRVPDELTTPEAKKWMEYAVSKGLLDKDWMPTDKVATKPQKALLVELLCERIGLRSNRGTLYKPFEVLWKVSGLAQERYKSKEEKGAVRGGEMIEEAFK